MHLPIITLIVASKIPEENKFNDQRDKKPPIFEHWILFETFYKRDFSSLAQSESSSILAPGRVKIPSYSTTRSGSVAKPSG